MPYNPKNTYLVTIRPRRVVNKYLFEGSSLKEVRRRVEEGCFADCVILKPLKDASDIIKIKLLHKGKLKLCP